MDDLSGLLLILVLDLSRQNKHFCAINNVQPFQFELQHIETEGNAEMMGGIKMKRTKGKKRRELVFVLLPPGNANPVEEQLRYKK